MQPVLRRRGGKATRAGTRSTPSAGETVAVGSPRHRPSFSPTTKPLVAGRPPPASCGGGGERLELPDREHTG